MSFMGRHAPRILIGSSYSTIWLARGLPEDGELITLELKEHHANVSLRPISILGRHAELSVLHQIARENIAHAGVANKVTVVQGAAADSLKKLPTDKPFDFVFIDADKQGNLAYFLEAKRLTRKGAVIVCVMVRHV